MSASYDIKDKLNEYIRIIRLSRKPDRKEFSMVSKVAGAGILIIGAIGFIIYLLMTDLPRFLLGT